MPNIRVYENRQGLSPDDRAARSTSFAANTVRASYSELGRELGSGISALGEAYSKYQTQQELSAGLSTSAAFMDNGTTAVDVVFKNSDPNDPSTAQRVMDEYIDPNLDAWKASFQTEGGKRWAEQQAARMREHFFEKAAGLQGFQAGRAAVQNIGDLDTSGSNTVFQDPASLGMMLGMADNAIKTIVGANPHLDARTATQIETELREKLRTNWAQSAMRGAARANPDAAMEALQSGKLAGADINTLLSAEEKDRLFGYAEDIKRSRASDARAAETSERQKLEREADAFLTSAYAKGIQPDGTWLPPANYAEAIREAASKHPEAFSRSEVQSAIGAAEHAVELRNSRSLQVDDPATYEALTRNIGANNKTAIYQAFIDGKLSDKTKTTLLSAIDDATNNPSMGRLNTRINDMTSGLKSSITKSNPYALNVYPEQDQKFYEFESMVRQTMTWAVKTKGMDPDEAAFEYLDPRGKSYLGHLLPRYQLTPDQLEAAQTRATDGGEAPVVAPSRPAPAALPRQPGESPTAYLKRTGG